MARVASFVLFLAVLSMFVVHLRGRSMACVSQLYCGGKLLDTIQRSGLFPDSKTFVDMPTKKPEAEVLAAFFALPENATLTELNNFVVGHFDAPGIELEFPTPADWKEQISLFDAIGDGGLKDWSKAIHSKWKALLRQFNPKRLCDGCVSSHLVLKHPFVIPGGRFREFYYWDSYWILEGLLISEMFETAKGVVLNFLSIVEQHGFVPNGSRVYYLNRSQPPMLVQMVKLYMDRTGDSSILKEALPLLDKEYLFWMRLRSVEIKDPSCSSGSSDCPSFQLNAYRVDSSMPRPESHMEDIHLGSSLPASQRGNFYMNIASAAESGWDFSSRWLRFNDSNAAPSSSSSPELTSIDIVNLVPLDLNALLYSNERILSRLHRAVADASTDPAEDTSIKLSFFYENKAIERYMAMKSVLWSETHQMWSDFNLTAGETRLDLINRGVGKKSQFSYISDFSPLWFFQEDIEVISAATNSDIFGDIKKKNGILLDNILEKLLAGAPVHSEDVPGKGKALWNYPGGIPTSEIISGQQWDFPNAWAPFQYYLVEALMKRASQADSLQQQKYEGIALDLASRWIKSTYCGWKRTGQIFEKYNALYSGLPGEGGEYVVQEGFGWTNAVILMMLKRFGAKLKMPSECNLVGAQDSRLEPAKMAVPSRPALVTDKNRARLAHLHTIIQKI